MSESRDTDTETANGAETIEDPAAALAGELRDDGIAILPRGEVVRRLKARVEADAVDHDAVRSGFESAGWEYSRHVYFNADDLRERAIALSEELGAANHLLVTEEEVVDRVADPIERGDQDGWRKGKAVAVIRTAFDEEGWMVRDVDAGSSGRTLYLLPLFEVIRDLHPNGRPPLSTDDLFRYYVGQSIRWTVSDE